MPAVRNKRQRETDTPYLYYAKGAEAKKRRLDDAAEKRMLIRGGFRPQAVTPFVPRTPGGQVTSDAHYYDAQKSSTSVLQLSTSWIGSNLDAENNAAAAISCLFAPVQGDDITNRQGRKVFVKKLRIQGSLQIVTQTGQSTIDMPTTVRLILLCDKQTNGTQCTGDQVISSGNNTFALKMFQSTANFGRFRIYKDKTWLVKQGATANDTGNTGGMVQGGVTIPFKMVCSPNCWVNFNATNGGTVADIIDNSFHLIGNSDNASGGVVMHYKVRTTFIP